MSNRVYLDYASATPLDSEVLRVMESYWREEFANPASIHEEGVRAAQHLALLRVRMAECFGVQPRGVTFTGSVTEALTLGVVGAVRAWRMLHPGRTPEVIVSSTEHEAVLGAARSLLRDGAVVHYLPVDHEGVVRIEQLESLLSTDTVVVAIMHGNNEIGTVAPIPDVARVIRAWKQKHRGVTRDARPTTQGAYPLLLVDAAQSAQTHRLDTVHLGADLLALSSAKSYGPKGVGALLSRTIAPLDPIIPGGSHEFGRRAGTPSLPVIAGMVEALVVAQEHVTREHARYCALREHMVQGLKSYPDITVHGSPVHVLPHIVNFSVKGISHEYLALLLDRAGYAVATKSACHESQHDASHVLLALCASGGVGEVEGVRVSFGRATQTEHITQFLRDLPQLLAIAIASRDIGA